MSEITDDKRLGATSSRRAAVEAIRGGVVVSCQATSGGPLDDPSHIAALAGAAECGGAVGFRVDGPANIRAVREITACPIIGISKQRVPGFDVYITPTFASALAAAASGADIVAVDATARQRPGGEDLASIILRLHEVCGVAVMADISSLDEALAAVAAGADVVATTLAGYTPDSLGGADHNAALAGRIATATNTPVVVEGGLWTAADVRASFDAGAYAVVVGSAVTAPDLITQRLVAVAPGAAASNP